MRLEVSVENVPAVEIAEGLGHLRKPENCDVHGKILSQSAKINWISSHHPLLCSTLALVQEQNARSVKTQCSNFQLYGHGARRAARRQTDFKQLSN